MEFKPPFLVFLGDSGDARAAKTAFGLRDWRREWCIGQARLPGCAIDLGLPDMAPAEAAARGARAMVVGISPRGGALPEGWVPCLLDALGAGLDLVNGLHQRLGSVAALAAAAEARGVRLHDVRHPPAGIPLATALPRGGRRLLTVGTDQNIGKKYTALALEREFRGRGIDADFRATGQTGIMIAGGGIAVDAVPGDFITGAVEALTPANHADHWDVIEGQGCVLSPTTAASVGLVNGAAAHALVMCHEPTRRHMNGLPHVPVPPIGEVMDAVMLFARRRNPEARFVGLSVNTSALPEREARRLLDDLGAEFSLPATDPIRFGAAALADAALAAFPTTRSPELEPTCA